jgi:hypothetical protein
MEASKSKGQGAAATAPNETVESRAIGAGRTAVRRGDEADVERADTRGAYRDLNGTRRIIGAGGVVPAGWKRIEDADLASRVEGLEVRGGPEGNAGEAEGGGTGGGAKK